MRCRASSLPSTPGAPALKPRAAKESTRRLPSGLQPNMNTTNSPQSRDKPILLVDIDGVISLFGFEPDKRPAGTWHSVEGMPHLLSATAAEHLHELAEWFDPVWCSGWEEKASEHLPLLLGVPRLPHLSFERN